MNHAIKLGRLSSQTSPIFSTSTSISLVYATRWSKSCDSVRFVQVNSATHPEHTNFTNMDAKKAEQKDKKLNVMEESFGGGYSTRCDEEGFGGVYGGNDECNAEMKIVQNPCWINYRATMFNWRSSQNYDDGNDPSQREAKVKELKVVLGPLFGRDKKFCTEGCLRRYLEARSWNVDNAKTMLEETLKWRASYKPEEIRWHEVAHEGETGKISRANFHDREGRTVLLMRPGKQNTTSPEGNIRHLVYMLENAILNLPEGQEEMCWLIDFIGFSMSKNVSVRTARDIVNILQNHYPERLAIEFLYNPPRIFQAFWNVVKYFLDPKTYQKIKFVYPNNKESEELMRIYFDMENLPKEFGGNATLEYDHEEFSKLMTEDDAKTSELWGFGDEPRDAAYGHSEAEVASEPL